VAEGALQTLEDMRVQGLQQPRQAAWHEHHAELKSQDVGEHTTAEVLLRAIHVENYRHTWPRKRRGSLDPGEDLAEVLTRHPALGAGEADHRRLQPPQRGAVGLRESLFVAEDELGQRGLDGGVRRDGGDIRHVPARLAQGDAGVALPRGGARVAGAVPPARRHAS